MRVIKQHKICFELLKSRRTPITTLGLKGFIISAPKLYSDA